MEELPKEAEFKHQFEKLSKSQMDKGWERKGGKKDWGKKEDQKGILGRRISIRKGM